MGSNRAPGLIAESIIMTVIATVALFLRCWARALSQQRFWWDDWLAIATLVTFTFQFSDADSKFLTEILAYHLWLPRSRPLLDDYRPRKAPKPGLPSESSQRPSDSFRRHVSLRYFYYASKIFGAILLPTNIWTYQSEI